jgi:hypothetical protein
LLRAQLRRQKVLKLNVQAQPGKAFSDDEKDRMHAAASQSRSPSIRPALALAVNAGMRDSEMKRVQWLNSEVLSALVEHTKWYAKQFGELRPTWYVFSFGRPGQMDPSRPITTLKTAWKNVRSKAKVTG